MLRFTAVGSVDDGKSTLIGRLLHDQHAIYEDELASVRRLSSGGLELALITDGLRAERAQGITIDVAYRHFSTPRRRFMIADTPGHEQYTRNMASGASTASAAVVLVDITRGVLSQTLRHAYLSWLLGVRHLCLAVNKMDLVGFGGDEFTFVCDEFRRRAGSFLPRDAVFIPLSALEGDNVVLRSERMPWYRGPTLIEYLDTVDASSTDDFPWFRFPVQYVLRGADGRRAYAGQVASGVVQVGDELLVLPSRKLVRVESIQTAGDSPGSAFAPMSVSIRLSEQVDLCRGDMLVDPRESPVEARRFSAILFWMSDVPLAQERPYLLKHTTQQVCGEVTKHIATLDVETMQYAEPSPLGRNGIGRVLVETQRPLFCDPYTQSRAGGSFILIDPLSNNTIAAGLIEDVDAQPVKTALPSLSQRGMTIWLTGLSSAGKTTLAQRVSESLLAMLYKVEMLDGDVVRKHLSKDLGFSKEDRDENIRRIGFVAELLSRNGVVVVVAAISPYRAVRDEIRRRTPNFIEVYVNAPLEVCERRDVKGLYRKARAGELTAFTGVDDPYEPPLQPELECRTDLETIEESAAKIMRHIRTALSASL